MPAYANGKKVELGDIVRGKDNAGHEVMGKVVCAGVRTNTILIEILEIVDTKNFVAWDPQAGKPLE